MELSFIRLFFAIDLPPESKNLLQDCIANLRNQFQKHFKSIHCHWVKPENIHITLQFLAQVNEEDVTKLLQHVRDKVNDFKSFVITLGPLEWFPTLYHPRVVSLKTNPNEVLTQLSQIIGQGITEVDYEIETRPYRGHLTLGRVDGDSHENINIENLLELPALPKLEVKEIVLFRSDSDKGGSVYTRLASIMLEQNTKAF